MARKSRLTLSEYSRCLPEGIIVKYSSSSKTFALMKDGYDLAIRHEEIVTQWKRPAEVFGYIARRVLKMPKEDQKRTQK